MTTTTFADYDIPFNRFDQPLLGVASDAVHLVYFWPMTSLGIVDKDWWVKHTEDFKRMMLEKQRGLCTWCEKPLDYNDITVDHVWPISKGGRNCVLNYQVLHWWCGIEKSDSIDWVLKRDLYELIKSIDALRRTGVPIPPIPIKPEVAFIVAGGVALVVGGYCAAQWICQDVDGERRIVRMTRATLESLSRSPSTLAGHMEVASEQFRSSACEFTHKARDVAGQLGRDTARREVATAVDMPGRVGPAATKVRDASSERLAEPVGQAVRGARRAGGSLGGSAWTAVTLVKSGASHAPGLLQSQAGRVAGLLPRPRRKTQPAFALST